MAKDVSLERDVFISHAGEDKKDVARPLGEALTSAGWSVWLDQYELTVGDSLYESINDGLARSRFGVVILSEAFFGKHWPRQELNGLAAREAASGSKVILPVWHGIDHEYLAKVAPMLANRLGVSTDDGIRHVAQELIRALARERRAKLDPERREPVVRSIESSTPAEEHVPRVPRTPDERDLLLQTRPDLWEYLLFAGELFLGKQALEPLWFDHELRVGQGQRRYLNEAEATDYLGRTFRARGVTLEQITRPLTPEIQQQAFGLPGEPGDPMRIQQVARLIVSGYEDLMRTAAELRNQTVPREFEDAYELAAQVTDQPVQQLRDFIDRTVSEIDGLHERLGRHPATEPLTIKLDLTLSIDDEVGARLSQELDRIGNEALGDAES